MQYNMLKGKIHRAVVKQADLNYVGSITVDTDLLEAAGILEYELVQIVDVENGNRFETYTIAGEAGSGMICLNGAAARQVAQRGAQIGHIGQRLHPLRKQHLQRAAGAVQRNETHRTNDHQQHQRKDRAEVQARTNGTSAQSVHGAPLQILTSTLATQL
mgnify:CR=1 FL=1